MSGRLWKAGAKTFTQRKCLQTCRTGSRREYCVLILASCPYIHPGSLLPCASAKTRRFQVAPPRVSYEMRMRLGKVASSDTEKFVQVRPERRIHDWSPPMCAQMMVPCMQTRPCGKQSINMVDTSSIEHVCSLTHTNMRAHNTAHVPLLLGRHTDVSCASRKVPQARRSSQAFTETIHPQVCRGSI
jgi:hypothetical protein